MEPNGPAVNTDSQNCSSDLLLGDWTPKEDQPVDLAVVRRYVELLTGSPDTPMHWRFLPEPGSPGEKYASNFECEQREKLKAKGDPNWHKVALQRNYSGTLAEVSSEMIDHQKTPFEWGIFAVINEGGTRGAQIDHVRALFIDMDGKPIPRQFHIEPDFIVQRDETHWHAYWLVNDCAIDQFETMQKRLIAYYGSDPNIIDLPRVLRTPGTRHQKNPDLTHDMKLIERRCGPARSLAEITNDLPAICVDPRQEKRGLEFGDDAKSPADDAGIDMRLRRKYARRIFDAMLEEFASADVNAGWRHHVINKTAFTIFGIFDDKEVVTNWFVGEFLPLCDPIDYDASKVRTKVDAAYQDRKDKKTLGTISPKLDFNDTFAKWKADLGIKEQTADAEQTSSKSKSGLRVYRGDEIEPEEYHWIWRGHFAAGTLGMIVGVPGAGKSGIASKYAAILSRGGHWPDGTRAPLGDTLFWDGEEDIRETILPRFLAQGGDRNRFHIVEGLPTADGKLEYFDPARHMGKLIEEAEKIEDLKLIVISPLISVVGDSKMAWNDSGVRQSLAPLVELARARGAVIEGVMHFNKNSDRKSVLDRIANSQAFGAVPRIIHAAVISKDHMKRRLVRVKASLGKSGPVGGFDYTIKETPVPNKEGMTAADIEFGPYIPGPAEILIRDIEEGISSANPQPAVREAMPFLEQLINAHDGRMRESEIEDEAKQEGITLATLRRAKKQLGIESRQFVDGWVWGYPWALPPKGMQVTAQALGVGDVTTKGAVSAALSAMCATNGNSVDTEMLITALAGPHANDSRKAAIEKILAKERGKNRPLSGFYEPTTGRWSLSLQ